ncbi:MAG: hypothetical protein IJW20_03960 [Clostridia bacterium]|nr:hypothetical protein [Clostridia bacterium]
MERQIVLKIKDGNVEKEYPLKVTGNSNEKWSQILEYLFNEDSIKVRELEFRRIFAACTDETLVAVALGSYSGSLTNAHIEKIMKRFPKSEDIQLGLALYASASGKKELLQKILEHPATEHVKQEVEYILGTL